MLQASFKTAIPLTPSLIGAGRIGNSENAE